MVYQLNNRRAKAGQQHASADDISVQYLGRAEMISVAPDVKKSKKNLKLNMNQVRKGLDCGWF